MSDFTCPMCAQHATIIEVTAVGGWDVIRFECECGESGLDYAPIAGMPAVIPVLAKDAPKPKPDATPMGTPWRAQTITSRKPPKPKREKRDKPKRKQPPKPSRQASLEARAKAAWDEYVRARVAFRAGVVSRAKTDIARDQWIELSKKLRRYESQEVKEIA